MAKVRIYYGFKLDSNNDFCGMETKLVNDALRQLNIDNQTEIKLNEIEKRYPEVQREDIISIISEQLSQKITDKNIKSDYIYVDEYVGFIFGVKLMWLKNEGLKARDISSIKQYNNSIYNVIQQFGISVKLELITSLL